MKLTREQAIDWSIELWEFCALTGKRKEDWPRWKDFGGLDEDNAAVEVDCECFLCEYGEGQRGWDKCRVCPYNEKFGWCVSDGQPFCLWFEAKQTRTRKKYAALFLEQLKALKK